MEPLPTAAAGAPAPRDREASTALAPPPPGCSAPLAVYEGGREKARVCAERAESLGLTVVDLSDTWAPPVFDEVPALGKKGQQPYRARYLELAQERLGPGPEFDRARGDRYLELYGVFPTPGVVARRLAADARSDCHDAIDDGPLDRLERPLDPFRSRDAQLGDRATARALLGRLEGERRRRGAESLDALSGDRFLGPVLAQYRAVSAPLLAIGAAQAHLRCDGLLTGAHVTGISDLASAEGLGAFQRKQMIVAWQLDAETREALEADRGELDFRDLLRVLRERVVDASGLLEDGSALGGPGTVAGRTLDSQAFRASRKLGPLPDGAPDLISPATDVAATALGWTSPAAASAFFERLGPEGTAGLKVALRLPPAPAYHRAHMELHAVIDRGDVVYDYPFTASGGLKVAPGARRPTLVLYAKDGDRERPLMRWPTTIGGWQPERTGRRTISMVYKESPPGPRVWRDLILAPVWIPPEDTPRRDLVRPRAGGEWVIDGDQLGPGYASAFGLVKLVHHRVQRTPNPANAVYHDEGVGTHGSASYASIDHGVSHGCHRLYNHLALRLGAFLLRHRSHVARGTLDVSFGRSFPWEGQRMHLAFESGGFRHELTPPVPVDVLPGAIAGSSTSREKPRPLPAPLAKRFVQERLEP